MAVGQVVVIARSVQIGRHQRHVLRAVLPVVALADFHTRDFRDGIRLVGLLQRAGQQIFLLDRLRAVARIDAAGAKEHQPLNACQICTLNEVCLDGQIFIEKFAASRVVRNDAANASGGDKNKIRPLGYEISKNSGLIQQVQLLMRANQYVRIAGSVQVTSDCRTHHPAVSGNKYASVTIQNFVPGTRP